MATNDQQLDEIFRTLGPMGRFVKQQLFIIWLGYLPGGLQLFSNVFIGPPVPHRCASPNNETEFINSYIDTGGYSDAKVFYDECAIHIKSNDTTIKKETCLFGMDYDLPVDSSFVSQFDLVCDSTNLARLTQTFVIAGQSFGTLIAAILSDRLGRKPVIIGAHIGITLTGIAIAYSTNYVMFSIFKFVVGGFQQAIMTVMTSILVELMTIKNRRVAAVLGAVFWSSGVILLDLIAYVLRYHSWRTVQLVITLVTVPAFIEICFLKESLRWLLANEEIEEASEYIKKVARMNGRKGEDITHALRLITLDRYAKNTSKEENDQQEDKVEDSDGKSSKKMSYLDLFRHRRLFFNIFALWVAWFTVALGFFAIYLGSTSLAGDGFLNFFLIALMEFPGKLYIFFALNRYGRKTSLIVMFLTMSVCLIASGIFRSFENSTVYSGLSVTFNMVAMIGTSGGVAILFYFTPELFPTNVRNQALSISLLMSGIGGMLAPFAAILGDQAEWGPGALIGGLGCLVAVLVRFLPETTGRELPQTLDDLLMWFKKDTKNNGEVKNVKKTDQNVYTVM